MRNSSPAAGSTRHPTPHVLDCTMFWSPGGGGVRRYLETKRDWLVRRSGWGEFVLRGYRLSGDEGAADRIGILI